MAFQGLPYLMILAALLKGNDFRCVDVFGVVAMLWTDGSSAREVPEDDGTGYLQVRVSRYNTVNIPGGDQTWCAEDDVWKGSVTLPNANMSLISLHNKDAIPSRMKKILGLLRGHDSI